MEKSIEEYEAERADDRVRIRELEAERDADRKREYGYSQQTVDALTLERDKLRAERNDWKARYQSVAEMHDALIKEYNEVRAENKRLREQYNSLIFEVSYKFSGESRHDTAKRYIREREEHGIEIVGKQALTD